MGCGLSKAIGSFLAMIRKLRSGIREEQREERKRKRREEKEGGGERGDFEWEDEEDVDGWLEGDKPVVNDRARMDGGSVPTLLRILVTLSKGRSHSQSPWISASMFQALASIRALGGSLTAISCFSRDTPILYACPPTGETVERREAATSWLMPTLHTHAVAAATQAATATASITLLWNTSSLLLPRYPPMTSSQSSSSPVRERLSKALSLLVLILLSGTQTNHPNLTKAPSPSG